MKDSLGDRMKGYENVTRNYILKRTPVIIRVDGKAFHSLTKRNLSPDTDNSLHDSPFSEQLHKIMCFVTWSLCDQIQNAVFAYTQSDEISILLRDWDKHETEQWFGGGIQKMCSVSASIATLAFNNEWKTYFDTAPGALFDSRVFNLPREEVVNYFIWRQKDASRNSVQMLGRHYMSAKQMHGLSNSQIQDWLMLEHSVNWNDLSTWKKQGTCFFRNESFTGSKWEIDEHPPIFTQDRNYVEKRLIPDETI